MQQPVASAQIDELLGPVFNPRPGARINRRQMGGEIMLD
jgi:hypothetical protein